MVAKHKFWRTLTRVHKWAGAVLGVQIILWFASGLFMSFFDIDRVHGDFVAEKVDTPLSVERVVSVEQAGLNYKDGTLISANLRSVLGHPVWHLTGTGHDVFINGISGEIWQGVSDKDVKIAASRYYLGDGVIGAITKLDIAPRDYRDDVPVWQVKYDDASQTRLYISPDTGELLKTRTSLWRAFDFMWMLHIMGYPDRDNINAWWLVLAAFAALMFALSGMVLVVHRIFLRPKPISK